MSTAIDSSFDDAFLKIGRAEEHLQTYFDAYTAFVEAETDPFMTGTRPYQGEKELPFQPREASSAMRLAAADTLSNLRAALDIAVWSAMPVTVAGRRNIYFPTGISRAAYQKTREKHCDGLDEDIGGAIDRLEPYYGGDGYRLRALHELNVGDKHRSLLRTVSGVRALRVSLDSPDAVQGCDAQQPVMTLKLVFAVQFSTPKVLSDRSAGQAMAEMLVDCRDAVERIAEAATRNQER